MAEEAIAKAKAIALKLSGGISSGAVLTSDLGKRKNRWEDESKGGIMAAGLGGKTIVFYFFIIYYLFHPSV